MLPQILTQKFITGVVRAFPQQAYIGSELLPIVGVPGLETMWDVINKDNGMAPFVAMDAESPLADKAGIERAFSELASIREKEVINESDLLALRLPGEADVISGLVNTQRASAETEIRRKADRLTGRVYTRVEWMRWQALSVGSITYDDKKVKFTVPFGIPADHIITLTLTDRWSDTTNSDPLEDLTNAIELIMLDAGYTPTRAYVGNNVPKYLAQNEKIRSLIKYNSKVESLINTQTVLSYLGDILGLSMKRYAAQYQSSGTDTFLLGADKVVITCEPKQADGETLGDVASGPAKANNFETGIYGWAIEEEDPWVTFVGSGIHAFPRIRHPKWIVIINVNG
jgi:hypothetical protein